MRTLEAEDFRGRVTFVTGPGSATGKTCLLNAALALLRAEGGSPAIFGLGFDGEGKGAAGAPTVATRSNRGCTRIRVLAGELFVSAEAWLVGSAVNPEILAALPGGSALGRLALARAKREGEVMLVGPDGNEVVAEAVGIARDEFGAGSVLVDGALNRITQVATIPGSKFFSSVRLNSANLESQARKMRVLARLTRLPLSLSQPDEPTFDVVGPLTSSTMARLPESVRRVTVDDFTKIFLDETQLAIFLRGRELALRRVIDFGGFVLVLQGLDEGRVVAALGRDFPVGLLVRNPYECGSAREVT